jgi:hypothetical protein
MAFGAGMTLGYGVRVLIIGAGITGLGVDPGDGTAGDGMLDGVGTILGAGMEALVGAGMPVGAGMEALV